MLAAALLALLELGPEPAYPLHQTLPDLTRPGDPFVLTDLRWQATDVANTAQQLALRARFKSFGFVSAELDNQLRAGSLASRRLALRYEGEGGRHSLGGSWRASRLLLELDALRRPAALGRSVVVDASLGLRLGPDFELRFGAIHDSEASARAALASRTTRRAALGFLYQRGTRLELSADMARSRIQTVAGIESDRDRIGLGAIFASSHAQASVNSALELTTGRLPRRQGIVEAETAVHATDHVVLELGARHKWEFGLASFDSELRGGLSFFGRRHVFSRAGRAAELAAALQRKAVGAGYNERRVYAADALRAQRERLALAPLRDELAGDLLELHAAQVAERNVSQAGVFVARAYDDLNGTKRWSYTAFLGFPWPPAPPWRVNEDAVPFLGIELSLDDVRFDPGVRSIGRSLLVTAELKRDLSLRFRWTKPGLTPLDLARLQPAQRRWELGFTYAYGR